MFSHRYYLTTGLLTVVITFQRTTAFAPTPLQPRVVSSRTSIVQQASSSSRAGINWITKEPLESLLPKDDALAIISELLADKSLIDDSEELVATNWKSLEARLRNETRSSSEILGAETTDRILKAVQSVDAYDAQSVRAFLESDAILNLFSRVLYDGIFEFFQKIDVFGQIINGLPIIGPIRKQIVTETKKQLDRSLGPLVQNFLSTYTKIAVGQASEYVLSPSNRKAFGSANVKLVSSVLERPVNSLLPPADMADTLQTNAFEFVRSVDPSELDEYVDFVYDFAGDKNIDRVVDVDRVLDASPTLQKAVDNIWNNAQQANGE